MNEIMERTLLLQLNLVLHRCGYLMACPIIYEELNEIGIIIPG